MSKLDDIVVNYSHTKKTISKTTGQKMLKRDIKNLMTQLIDSTYMILSNDISSLLTHDEVARIRKQHKDELHQRVELL